MDSAVHFTKHALGRALDMQIGPDELRRAVESHTAKQITHRNDCTAYWDAERITLAVKEEDGGTHIMTVLWRTDEAWRADYAAAPAASGREPRANPRRAAS